MKSKATAQPPERENLHNVLVMEEASTEARLFHFPCVLFLAPPGARASGHVSDDARTPIDSPACPFIV